jgi:hypothetical protein
MIPMQHPFALTTTREATCTHVNIRDENHGDEKVLAVDLAFWMEGSNDLLDLFHPELRSAIYCNKAADQGQVELDEKLAVLPNLRAPGFPERLRFGGDDKHGGYRMVCDFGLGDAAANVDLTECVVAKKWYEPKEGGTVRIGWRVSYAGEALQDVMTRGKLAGLKGQKAFIELHAPAVLQVITGGKGKKPVKTTVSDGNTGEVLMELGGDDARDAGDIFAEQHGEPAAVGA